MLQNIKTICENNNLQCIKSSSISGGDISASYGVDTDKGRFFLKLNSNSLYPLMFEKEAEGLKALQQASLLKVPEVIAAGVIEDQQYLLMEWLEKTILTASNFWENFANGLAQLHKITSPTFGWPSSNYIGSLQQQNKLATTWAEFYATQRIMPLVENLFNRTLLSKADVDLAEQVCKRFNEIFPAEPASLLHGDLWAGNFMAVSVFTENGSTKIKPSIYDPAVYFGHREMDIGMSLLFGGFDVKFYEAYNNIFPLERDWRKRVSITQLYPLLVHAVLFKGSYVKQAQQVLQVWR